jgi:hypothetical protein
VFEALLDVGLTFAGPAISVATGGVGGIVLAELQSGTAKKAIKVGQAMARGDHLTEKDKAFAHHWRRQNYTQQRAMFGWR